MSDFSAYILLYMPSLTECQDFPEKKKYQECHEMRGENDQIQQPSPLDSVNGRDGSRRLNCSCRPSTQPPCSCGPSTRPPPCTTRTFGKSLLSPSLSFLVCAGRAGTARGPASPGLDRACGHLWQGGLEGWLSPFPGG